MTTVVLVAGVYVVVVVAGVTYVVVVGCGTHPAKPKKVSEGNRMRRIARLLVLVICRKWLLRRRSSRP